MEETTQVKRPRGRQAGKVFPGGYKSRTVVVKEVVTDCEPVENDEREG